MLISVIIPVYNIESSFLKRSLDSVLETDSSDIEVVVVDDGSKDENSFEYSMLCNEDQRVRYIKKKNGGPSSARNFGASKATGDYIMFLDSDDYLTPNCIKDALNMCADNKADIIMGYVQKRIGGGY